MLTQIQTLNLQQSTINASSYAYNNASQRIGVMDAANDYWVYEYDDLGQVKSGKKYWANGTPVAGQQYEFTYDTIGNVLTTATGGDATGANLRSASFTANHLNQYTNRTVAGYADTLGLANSNSTITVNGQSAYRNGEYFRAEVPLNNSTGAVWLTFTNVGILQAGWGNADLVSTNLGHAFVSATPQTLTYDPDGNQTNDGHFSYSWDQENRLTRMVSLTNTPTESKRTVTADYDWLGRRIRLGVSILTNSTWRVVLSNKFVYDGWSLAAELNATNNAVLRTYAWGLDLSGTMNGGGGGVGGLLWVNDKTALGTNSSHFVAYDGNGNVSALVDAGSGNETARYEYGPFGDLIRASGPMALANPIRFSSKYHDDATGLIYYGYRYYSPGLHRWLSRDPLGEEGGLNLYGFVGNDPVNGADALGLWNLWNPATWGVANGVGWSAADSLNPFHESASWDGYSGDYFRQSLASATGFGVFGKYDECDQSLASTRMLGQASTLALEIFGPMRLAQWAEGGVGLWRAGTALGLNSYGLYQSAGAIGTGAGKLSAGDQWGGVELGLGLLGVKPGVGGVLSTGSSFASGVKAWNAAGAGVETAVNQAAFWSGRQGLNRAAAEASGLTTLEKTPGGIALESQDFFSKLSYGEAIKPWEALSKQYAQQAKGTVTAWTGGASPMSVWKRMELPTLLWNSQVKKIIIKDATQHWKTKIIYK